MNPEFIDHPVRPGFVVVDAVHNRRVPFVADGPVSVEPADPDAFRFPVSSAVEVDAGTLTIPYVGGVYVREPDGEAHADIGHEASESFPDGNYLVELNVSVKSYLLVDGPFAVDATESKTTFEFGDGARVRVGARSYHEQPAGTITVTEDPRDVLDAISLLSSSLKDRSPERSFPTLRGHAPLIEFGDEFAVPDGIESPDTGVTIEVPPEPEYLLPVASLSYYLGADLEPADRPQLVADTGFSYDLEPADGFEAEVERVLKQVFTLDCVTRTEGLYPVDLHERDRVEPALPFDPAEYYDRSIPEQLEAYLAVEYEDVADAVPNWPLTVDCRADLGHAEYLPFVVNDLGVLRIKEFHETEPRPELAEQVAEFTREDDSPAAGGSDGTDSVLADESFVELPRTDAISHAWIGEEWPHNADRFLKAGFENRIRRFDGERERDGSIDVTVVCNDDRMREEYEDGRLYGDRGELPFAVETHTNLTTGELRELLTETTTFFHYIGHVEGYEFVCEDGGLDVRSVDFSGPELFLINGCTSLVQGRELVEAGSVAGIVTLNDVGNRTAISIGQHLARLLNCGMRIADALSVVQDCLITGGQYVAVGDTGAGFVPPEDAILGISTVSRSEDGTFVLNDVSYPMEKRSIGGVYRPLLEEVEKYGIMPSEYPTVSGLTEQQLRTFFEQDSTPILYDGSFHWPPDLDL